MTCGTLLCHAGLENQKSHVGGYSCPPGKSAGGKTRVLAVSCLWCGRWCIYIYKKQDMLSRRLARSHTHTHTVHFLCHLTLNSDPTIPSSSSSSSSPLLCVPSPPRFCAYIQVSPTARTLSRGTSRPGSDGNNLGIAQREVGTETARGWACPRTRRSEVTPVVGHALALFLSFVSFGPASCS